MFQKQTNNTLLVLLGPTGVGKTDAGIRLAQLFHTEIVSCDSRQLYREMRIGTAMPSEEQLSAVRHHFIASRSVHEPYTAGKYETDALALLSQLFQKQEVVVMIGGSGLYIDAVCNGIDDFQEHIPELRESLMQRLEREGLEALRHELKLLDPESYHKLDLKNPRRILRALEVCLSTGKPFSSFKKEAKKTRPFHIVKIGLQRPREELYRRINLRTLQMMEEGWEAEARKLYPFRHLPALNTVGYKELFDYFDGKTTLSEAVSLIQQHTRNYAKKQLSYWGRDKEIRWVDAEKQFSCSLSI
ncbi:MAG: tRNA (adenosine(37)-N6)-dimethylallyltransferase MiaA [Bacteroidales bacterium]|nr:tRNA (adenosine(37)-N6)-dimethylallyltransferase MiaA [Bacteroidales bacterium]MCL2132983.1 tRNA (adenosine(37)-N6)-dimethylallyltransferase MiaA [Bacteroidales bacterium]